MFHWVVRHLRWLARVPGLPHWFDALLVAWTAVAHRPRLAAMEAVEAGALRLAGATLGVHRLGGIGFLVDGAEIGHLHGNGLLDVHLTRERAAELIASGRTQPHHVMPGSGWVSFQLAGSDDAACAIALLDEAAAARVHSRS